MDGGGLGYECFQCVAVADKGGVFDGGWVGREDGGKGGGEDAVIWGEEEGGCWTGKTLLVFGDEVMVVSMCCCCMKK